MSDRRGQQLGSYRLLRLLGQGGFADVYLGVHGLLGHQVAIKVLSGAYTEQEGRQFLKEAQTLAHLDHSHIVRLLDFAIESRTPFLVMDFAPGGTLRLRHPEGTKVPLESVVDYVRQVASAMAYAHEQELVHLDLKPENMLLNRHGAVLVSDFGLARLTASRRFSEHQIVGTISYMAPEQIQGKPRRASDQYALGVIAYEWLTGRCPFSGSLKELVTQHLSTPPPPLREFVPSIPIAVEQVILAALAKDPTERYASIMAFAEALELASLTDVSAEDLALLPASLTDLYKEGISAQAEGDWERALTLWQQVLERNPTFRNGTLAKRYEELREQQRTKRAAQLRVEANEAYRTGEWAREIATWSEIVDLKDFDQEASQRLELAQKHQRYAETYEDAEQFLSEGKRSEARTLLERLWQDAPYYGDPARLGRQVGLRVPPNYLQAEAVRKKKWAVHRRRSQRRDFVDEAFGNHEWAAWLAWFAFACCLSGIGAAVAVLTQSRVAGVLTVGLATLLGYLLGYRRAFTVFPLLGVAIGSAILAFLLATYVTPFHYLQPYLSPYTVSISTGFFTSVDHTEYHRLWLIRQMLFGGSGGVLIPLLCGLLGALARLANKEELITTARILWTAGILTFVEAIVWLSLATSAPSLEWGFGFDVGWPFMFLGLAIGLVGATGIVLSVPLWWKAFPWWKSQPDE